MSEAQRAVQVTVHGQVQGVFFRDSCREQAGAHRVAGWVRNDPGGTVTAVFAGTADAVDAMVAWARRGPAQADVQDIEVHDVDDPGLDGFEVR